LLSRLRSQKQPFKKQQQRIGNSSKEEGPSRQSLVDDSIPSDDKPIEMKEIKSEEQLA